MESEGNFYSGRHIAVSLILAWHLEATDFLVLRGHLERSIYRQGGRYCTIIKTFNSRCVLQSGCFQGLCILENDNDSSIQIDFHFIFID